ncbi:Uncharacterised protein [Legionella steigerwaltii]|uniref:Uncharacterized protein n=1 Tax=Legionella steigerwaltii TaxID=460 RepID=A0A378L735_9GAMM|nr:hypothetical protein [Legionella steigerwaltii]KTD80643.1 hypothetical protein Lstg_0479 [Legionella steigerwaltii]STY22517.1 Uncharacterised protein [Legionella steigerwaltii]
MESKSEKNKTGTPQMTVLIKETKAEDGICGHATVILDDGKGRETVTSVEPGIGGFFNIFSFPIGAINAVCPEDDKKQATVAFKTDLTQEQYNRALEKQEKISKKIETNEILYSFSGENSWSKTLLSFRESFSLKNFSECKLNEHNEDPFGGTVSERDIKPLPEELKKTKLHNCVTSSKKVIKQVDSNFGDKRFQTPSDLASKLRANSLFKEEKITNKTAYENQSSTNSLD